MANALDILEEYLHWEQARNREKTQRGVCRLGDDDSKVLPLRIGSGGVGTSAVGMGESTFDTAFGRLVHKLHRHSWVPCLVESGW